MSYEIVVDIAKIPEVGHYIYRYVLFEFFDSVTLKNVEGLLHNLRPGPYTLKSWYKPDVTGPDKIMTATFEFTSEEDYLAWRLGL